MMIKKIVLEILQHTDASVISAFIVGMDTISPGMIFENGSGDMLRYLVTVKSK